MRRFLQGFKLAFRSIRSNKMRSFLTMLGMIIGVASVIILTGLVNGVTNYLIESFSDMGTNMISVSVTNSDSRTATVDDMFAIAEENSDIFEGVSPSVTGSYTVKKGSVSETGKTITGVAENYYIIQHINVAEGRFIGYADITDRNKVCVVGTYIVDTYFTSDDVVGETIKIDGDEYTIVGILEQQADSSSGSSDDCIYIPYSVACRLTYTSEPSTFTFATYGTDYITRGESVLDDALYEIFKDESMYTVTSMSSLISTIESITGILSSVLAGIAGISLLVAGIGIMNIMLVSVIERTREIGIRKALGAKRADILIQFVIEAASISSLGGILGIAFGAFITVNVGDYFGLEASPSVSAIVVSFCVSAGIGIFFGFMPARRAAKLNPIDALKSE